VLASPIPRLRLWARARARRSYLNLRGALSGALIERRRGIETSSVVSLDELGLAADDRVRYEPSGWLDLRRILRPGEVSTDDVFIDFGSGKGRVLLQAARYPFRRIIGLELSPQLNAVARQNVERYRGNLRCPDIELVTGDVLEYEVPDDVTVVYIYNAFKGELFQALIDKLLASVDRRPRKLRLIYRTPLEELRLKRSGGFRLIRQVRGLRPGRAWSHKMSTQLYLVETARSTSALKDPERQT
jgi:hypothetical protein